MNALMQRLSCLMPLVIHANLSIENSRFLKEHNAYEGKEKTKVWGVCDKERRWRGPSRRSSNS